MTIRLPKQIGIAVLASCLSLPLAAATTLPTTPQAELTVGKTDLHHPSFIRFKQGVEPKISEMEKVLSKYLKSEQGLAFKFVAEETDQYGFTHYKFQQQFNGIDVFGARISVHAKAGKIQSISGNAYNALDVSGTYSVSENSAIRNAVSHVAAEVYMWEMPGAEESLRRSLKDDKATYQPTSDKLYVPADINKPHQNFRPSYKVDVYASKPLSRADYFVDATTGKVLWENAEIHHVGEEDGIGKTAYVGDVALTTQKVEGENRYRLQDDSRGGGVRTFDMKRGTNLANATDFFDADNIWDNEENLDRYATDAHYGSQSTYDFFFKNFGRNSIDNAGFPLISYVHYDVNYVNAFWNGQYMTYGDGAPGQASPLTAIDIAGHEISHGLTTFTANLVYRNESGALNESFSDIFGTAIEYSAALSTFDWLVGEDIGIILRSMSEPGLYGDPDTYFGTNWKTGAADNGGVHSNSGVQNYWFHILSVGASGTNDIGNKFEVEGIGVLNAAAVAFRNLTVYLSENSTYADARFYSIQSAIDIFGPCSKEVKAVADAWYACGVGEEYTPTVAADFNFTTFACDVPFKVDFTNASQNASSYQWSFGDGSNSQEVNPTHNFTQFGEYTVSLLADGGLCGIDRIAKQGIVKVVKKDICDYIMDNGVSTITDCSGSLYDAGGPLNPYRDGATSTITIAPTGAEEIILNFRSFATEAGFDTLYIYDGASINAPLLGAFTGTALPNGGTIVAGKAVTLRLVSDEGLALDGFALDFKCRTNSSAPIAGFTADLGASCKGTVTFNNTSQFANSFLWNFGDGTTSTEENPTHAYADNGVYNVKLTATNASGDDIVILNNTVRINKPAGPVIEPFSSCGPEVVRFNAETEGELFWFNALKEQVATGTEFLAGLLQNTTTFFVEERTDFPNTSVGVKDNTVANGGYFNTVQGIVMDVFKPAVLKKATFYARGDGNRTFNVTSATGVVLSSVTVFLTDGVNRVDLNLDIPVGTNLRLTTLAQSNLYRNQGGAQYPYLYGDVLTLKETTAAGQGAVNYVYFYYDMEFSRPSCISLKAAAKAVISATKPEIDVQSVGQACEESKINFTVTGQNIASLNWSTGSKTDSTNIVLGTSPQMVSIVAKNACGETKDSILVTPLALPSFESIPNRVIACEGSGPVQLTVGTLNTASLKWLPTGETTNTITYIPNKPEVFEVVATNACGSRTAKVQVSVFAKPTVEIAGTNFVCPGDYTILKAVTNGYESISWLPNNEDYGSIEARPTQNTVYTATVTNRCGTASATFPVNVIELADITIDNLPNGVCFTEEVVLNILPLGGSLSGAINSDKIIGAGRDAGTYELGYVFRDTDGCVTFELFNYDIYALPETPSIRLTNDFELEASVDADSYNWYLDGVLLSENTKVIQMQGSGTYVVVAVSAEGCESEGSEEFVYIGLSDITAQVSVFPVPFTSDLTLEVTSANVAKVTLLDNAGKVVRNLQIGRNTNFAGVAAGQYIVEITTVEGQIIRKQVVKY